MRFVGLALFCFINIPYYLKLGALAGDLLMPALVLWSLFSVAVFLFFDKAAAVLKSEGAWKLLAVLLVVSIILASMVIFTRKDPESLAVDRWSSTRAFWDMYFSGRFPYLGRSHLGNPISGLPFLEVALLPFYFAGEFGLSAVVTSLALAWLTFRLAGDYRRVVLLLLILIGSPAFWFEVLTRSDLLFNMGLVIFAVRPFFLASKTSPERIGAAEHSRRAVLLASLLVGLALCTRTVVVIPLLVLAPFVARTFSPRGSILIALAMVAGFLLPFLILLPWDFRLLGLHNPMGPQLAKGNPLVAVLGAAGALFLGFRVGDFTGWISRSLHGLALLLGLMLVFSLTGYGYAETIYGNRFDVSYLNLVLPLLALSVALTRRTAAA